MIHAATYGAPNWADLTTPHVESAAAFYCDLLGWQIARSETPMGTYLVGKIGEHEVAGMMAPGAGAPEAPPMWTVFFYVEDVDRMTELVAEAGGRIDVPPFEIPGDARVAIASDPTGAMFALISHPRPDGTWLSTLPGAVCWVELLTRDTTAAEGFYGQLFGWKAVTEDHRGTPYTVFSLDEHQVAGMIPMPAQVPAEAPAHWAVYFTVTDCAAAADKAVELGGRLVMPPTAVAMGHFAVLEDPLGAVFDVMDFATPEGAMDAMEFET